MVGSSMEITLKEVYNLLQQNIQSQSNFNSRFEKEIALISGQLQSIEQRIVQAQQAHELARRLDFQVQELGKRVDDVEEAVKQLENNLANRDHKTLWAIITPALNTVVSSLMGGGLVALILIKFFK